MLWLVLVVGGAAAWFVFRRSQAKDREVAGQVNHRPAGVPFDDLERMEGTAVQIAARVKTLDDLRRLEEHLAITEDAETTSENYDAWVKYSARIEDAVFRLRDKVLRWQYVPDLDLSTPLEVVERAFLVVLVDEFPPKRKEFKSTKDEWEPLQADDPPQEAPVFMGGLLAFRRLLEGQLVLDGLATKISGIADEYPEFKGEFFDVSSDLPVGEQWIVRRLKADGLPKAEDLYREGITTPESALGVDPEQFGKRPGIGPVTVAKLQAYQAAVRRRSEGSARLAWLG